MSETCKDCKHWEEPRFEDKTPDYGICSLAWTAEGGGPEGASRAYAETDDKDYVARLRTAPDFGCNQHESKEG